MAAITRWLTRHRQKFVHAARMTTASVAAFALVHAIGLPGGLWAVITALVVNQSSVGGSLKAVFEQFLGSLFGAVYGAAVALAIAPDDPLSRAAALVIALAPPSILAAFSFGFRIAPVTAALMLLLSGVDVEAGPLGLAASRILEVGLGCGVGLLVSVLVVPARASRSVLETTAQVASLLAAQLEALASGSGAKQAELGSLAVTTRESLIRLEVLVQEAARERRSWLTDIPDVEPLLRTMRRLRHDVSMLRRAAREAGHDTLHEPAAHSWLHAATTGATTLRRVGEALLGRRAPEDSNALAQAVRAYRNALDEMRRAGVTRSLSTATLGRLFGIGFALEQFRRDLDDLIERSGEIHTSRNRPARVR